VEVDVPTSPQAAGPHDLASHPEWSFLRWHRRAFADVMGADVMGADVMGADVMGADVMGLVP
jgi:hypothetical protein